MKYLHFLFALILLALPKGADALVHLELEVRIDMEKRKLNISGTASKPVTLPLKNKTATEFSYIWPLPPAHSPHDWQGGPYASNQALYLPHGWHPQTNELMTFDVTLTSPLVSVMPGHIHEESQTDTTYQARFVMDKPTEGIPLFAGPYHISQMSYQKTKLRSYFFKGMEHLAKGYLERTAKYLSRFEQQIGPYPFGGFHIIAAPIPAGFGFAGLTYVGARVLQLPFIKETSLGHEILHNYWGNGVFPDYTTGNWAEGLTTYMADYMTAERTSTEKAKDMRLSWLRDYNALPADQDYPVIDFKAKHGQASQVIGYHKVAFIFHMLRQKIGEDAFFQGLRSFWSQYKFSTASWLDLKQHFTQASGQDLSDFFAQWTTRTGAPEFQNISARTQREKGMGWTIKTRLMQGNPFYETHLPVAVGTGNGVLDKTLHVKGRLTQTNLHMEERPFALSLDPDFNIFRKLGTNEAPPILRDVMLADQVDLIAIGSAPFKNTALKLAKRLVDQNVSLSPSVTNKAFILIATHDDIAQQLTKYGLTHATFPTHENTTALIWADKVTGNTPFMVISLTDEQALESLLRPLPHYGKRHKLMFNGAKATFKSNGQARPISVPVH
ncbi:M1 family peptidase [Terasakiella sp. SH-1]|uniref:M1 family metallopeptidase n=1 Tax=Terasakiella sp. SH-1 TaxID=2560057 RepID=UPI00107319F1|nr:M1 family peptidase [Terasakiella sp. SH-1]